jgi:hypothetical protein
MTKTVVIHQPDFVPYLGFFQRFLFAEEFIVLDHVQFVTGTSRSWTHRDKVKTPAGEKWLSLSVRKSPLGTPINQIELSDSVNWVTANLALLKQNYSTAPFFGEVFPFVESLYENPPKLMVNFNLRSIELLMDLLDVRLPWVRSSELKPEGTSTEMLINLLRKIGATRYMSGIGARDYMELDKFARAGIEVVWQEFKHPIYRQQYGAFKPNLSSLDLLFNCGITSSRRILKETA